MGRAQEKVETAGDPRRVLVAERDPNVRSGLRLLLARRQGYQVVGECESLDEVHAAMLRQRPDVVLLDLDLPGLQPGQHLRELRALYPCTRTIALSTREEHREAALQAGAAAFVCKSQSPLQLLACMAAPPV